MKIKKITILTILTLALITGCGDKEKIDDSVVANGTAQEQSVTFDLKTTDGKDLKVIAKKEGWIFTGYENKVVLLNFFGTWCPPCKAEIPHLLNIRKKLKENFEIIAIDVGKRGGALNTQEELDAFIKEFGVTYPIVTGADNQKLFGAVSDLNPSGSIPFMILFNKKGQFMKPYIGMKPEEMLYSDISQTIEMK
ncbi:MAG: TlpA family protein disulfide reductase [Arcobacteraceae bacterium]|nr:TlpA family protein disulfide reductase [Arcobacteraceae bacterium]